MAKLNDTGRKKLAIRRNTNALQAPAVFSIIFLGDPHVGMNNRTNNTRCNYNNTNDYRALLRSIDSTDQSLIAVFNGGDGADNKNYVSQFKTVTENEMEAKTVKNIPFFSGVGNHEYEPDDLTLSNYRAYISSATNDVIHLYGKNSSGQNVGPKVAVIMLDTGGPETDGCRATSTPLRSGALIRNSIAQIESNKQYQSAIKDPSVEFIIDMHIPMQIQNNPLLLGDFSHVLCDDAQRHFHAFIQRIVQSASTNRILAFVTHHRHGYIQGRINSSYLYFNRPVFLTAQGGNCDPVAPTSPPRARLSYYNFIFATPNPKSRSKYELTFVYRLDVDSTTGTVISRPGTQIYP